MTPTIRRTPLDAPGCADWNAANRRARTEYAARPLTPWCEWPESEEPCYSRACRGGLCRLASGAAGEAAGGGSVRAEDKRHGTKAGYEAGCRDLCCRRAQARYQNEWRMSGPRTVDLTGTRRRLEALMVLGWSWAEVSRMLGHERSYARKVITSPSGRIQRRSAERIAELYERLCMSIATDPSERGVGWNASRERTRREALAKGYAPPLAWDDIDTDPRPKGVGSSPRNYRGSLAAEWHHLREAGVSIHQAAQQLGVTVGAIEKALERAKGSAA